MTKIALITGGSRGLGKSMALNLAQKGRDIILTYHTQKEQAEAVIAEIENLGQRAIALPLDIRDASTFPQFAQTIQQKLQEIWSQNHFDYLINNAGTGGWGAFLETNELLFDNMMKEHIKAPFFLSQALIPLLADGGRILNVSSGLTRIVHPGYAAYAIMKTAVEALTRYLAQELGPRKISVNTIAPGAIETDFGGGRVRDDQQVNDQVASVTALGRVGRPDDIGHAVAAILEDDASWINAQRIEVSGGQRL